MASGRNTHWVALRGVSTDAQGDVKSDVQSIERLGQLAVLLNDCLCPNMWLWQNGANSDSGALLINQFTQWLAEEGQFPSQERLDWWLAEWQGQAAHAFASALHPRLWPLGQWELLSDKQAERLLYGLTRLARHETGVLWVNAPLARLARQVDNAGKDSLTVVWAIRSADSPEAITAVGEALLATVDSPVQVILLESDSDKTDVWPVVQQLGQQLGRVRLCGRVAEAAVMSGDALPQLQDVVLRMNLPHDWLPPCQP